MISWLDLYSASRKEAEKLLNSKINEEPLLNSTCKTWKSSNLQAINFVYGEVSFSSMLSLLDLLDIATGSTFVDLGCGAGSVIAAAMMCGRSSTNLQSQSGDSHTKNVPTFSSIIGVDLQQFKIQECQLLCEVLSQQLNPCDKSLSQQIEISLEDVRKVNLEFADVVYICATCFTLPLLNQLFQNFTAMRNGALIIIIDKTLDRSVYDGVAGTEIPQFIKENDFNYFLAFKLLQTFECSATWGEAVARVYLKSF